MHSTCPDIPVHEEATNDGQDDVGPGVPRVEVGKLRRRYVHRFLQLGLQGARVIEAEIGSKAEQAHKHQRYQSVKQCLKHYNELDPGR